MPQFCGGNGNSTNNTGKKLNGKEWRLERRKKRSINWNIHIPQRHWPTRLYYGIVYCVINHHQALREFFVDFLENLDQTKIDWFFVEVRIVRENQPLPIHWKNTLTITIDLIKEKFCEISFWAFPIHLWHSIFLNVSAIALICVTTPLRGYIFPLKKI